MKRGFYFRLAVDGMRKNRKLYLPYLLTCAGVVMMFYILSSLSHSPIMGVVRGGGSVAMILSLGMVVIALFALLFLFYTNTFLIRRRNKEFGLYNILGMNKSNISRILVWENLLSACFSLVVGIAAGLLFEKLAEISLLHMFGESAGYALSFEGKSIIAALIFFGAIFALLLVVSLARVRLSKPLDLLKSEAAGEKPPKANWLFALAGAIILGAAYYLAMSIKEPLSAISLFFLAVLMVIVATYLLFIAGSVALCRLLQKKKGYYYKPRHFVSLSSMAFRMKRNGAGLASICILSTMVLVMISSTSCLYFGGEDTLRAACPYDVMLRLNYSDPYACSGADAEALYAAVSEASEGRERGYVSYLMTSASGYFKDGVLDVDGVARRVDASSSSLLLDKLRYVCFVPLSDYNRMTGKDIVLSPGEALVWSSGEAYPYSSFAIDNCRSLRVQGVLTDIPMKLSSYDTLITTYLLFVPDWEECSREVVGYLNSLGDEFVRGESSLYCCYDLPNTDAEWQIEAAERAANSLEDAKGFSGDYQAYLSVGSEVYAAAKNDFYSLNGSLFFLGIVLSIVFVAAAALIIYYKQLSEGYEDQSRFSIMQKVGMTKREIKSAINSQVLTVFFAPLLLAGVHLVFAFPFVQNMIRLFGVSNKPLLIMTNFVCFLVFALFYVFVYRGTARAYYAIVSDGDTRQ
jgi:putative ABC transport system permease protein